MRSVRVKLMDARYLPKRGKPGDAGFDLKARLPDGDEVTLLPGERRLIPTGVSLEIPYGWVGLLWPRSGLATRQGIDRLAGCIDAGFRGEVQAALINHSDAPVTFVDGDRIVQLLIMPIYAGDLECVESLPESLRGVAGFGSTGLREVMEF